MAIEAASKQRSRDSSKSPKGKKSKPDQPHSQSDAAAAGKLDERLIEKAVNALLSHHAKSADGAKDLLLGNEAAVQVLLGLEVAPQRAHVKPIPLNIPHGFLNGSAEDGDDPPSVCLIVKQESKQSIKELLDKFPKELGCVKKVLGLQSLRTKYHDYARRRELLHSFDVFMADDRILPMLTSALGKIFFKAKQQPIPVNVTRASSLPFNVVKALSRTHFSYSRGTCVLVVAGRTSMEPSHLVQNVVALVPQAVEKLPRQWANVRSISIKTPSSMALPVYNRTPQELMEIARLADLEPTFRDDPPEKAQQAQNDDKPANSKPDVTKEKSPLLQALRKQNDLQKKAGERPSSKGAEDANGKAAAKQGTPLSEPGGKKEKKRKVKENTGSSQAEVDEGERDDDEKPRPEKEAEDSRKKSKKEVDSPEPHPTPKRASVRKEPSESKKGRDEPSSSSSSFVAAKKYSGSKPGFVFQLGPRGLGYYVDVQPEVDRMALEAILRMAKNKGGRGGGGGGGGGGKSSKHQHSNNKRRGGGGRR